MTTPTSIPAAGPSAESPLALVRRLAEERATGELICALGGLEVHVYLQQGRVAWATSSAARFAFGRELLRRCRIDPTTLSELVEDCRRNRRPLGETLIAWSLATPEDVRESLRLQIRDALGTLAERATTPKLFLERGEQYLAYEKALTFALDELVDESLENAELVEHAGPTRLLERLVAEVPEILWAEVLRRGEALASWPPARGARPRTSPGLSTLAFGDDVELAVFRSASGATIGVSQGDDGSVWLGLGADARLGAVFGALGDLLPATRVAHQVCTPEIVLEGSECGGCAPLLRDVLARWSDAEAACVLHGDVPTVVHRRGVDAAAFTALARRRTPMLSLDEAPDARARRKAPPQRSIALARGGSWSLAAAVPDDSGRILWLALSREASQGLAWALLSATARQIAGARCEEPTRD